MSKILVIGGSGFIGKNLVKYFVACGHRVTVFDRFMASDIRCENAIVGDIYEYGDLEKLVSEFDAVINAISMVSPATALETFYDGYSRDIAINVKLMKAILGCKARYIFISSAGAIYGNSSSENYDENACLRPINFYGACKLSIESLCHVMNNLAKKTKYIAVRIANAFGPGQDYKKGVGFIDAVIKCALKGETLTVYGDGETVRDYIYIDDICFLMEKIVEYRGDEEVFNVSTGIGHSQNDIISIVKKCGYDVDVKHIDYRIGDIKRAVIDNGLVQALFGFEPRELEDSIKSFIDYIRGNEI